jgi:hypothetical protein
MPYCSASCWADVDTSGSKPLGFPLYSTPLAAKDLDHILTILGRILTDVVSMRPSYVAYRKAYQERADLAARKPTMARVSMGTIMSGSMMSNILVWMLILPLMLGLAHASL